MNAKGLRKLTIEPTPAFVGQDLAAARAGAAAPLRLRRLLRQGLASIAQAYPRRLLPLTALQRRQNAIEASGLFDPAWYAATYPDVAAGRQDAAAHFLRYGLADRRDPGPDFSTEAYLGLYPDLLYGDNPLLHFLDRLALHRAEWPAVLEGAVETVPPTLEVGRGIVLFVKGWCFAAAAPLRGLALRVGTELHSIAEHSQPRPDIDERVKAQDRNVNALFSGFATTLTFEPAEAGHVLALALVATLADGRIVERRLDDLVLLPRPMARRAVLAWPADGRRVAIAMATHEPPLALFARQIASIKAQTHANWRCILSDDGSSEGTRAAMLRIIDGDPRFRLDAHAARVGFYRNFERALQACPGDAEFIALADQDDRWYPDKLATLLAQFGGDIALVYSDVRIVGAEGDLRSETFWVTRANNFTSLAGLLSANTVIGAAAMFRAALLDSVLPFPVRLGDAYHDHWIALNALLRGSIGYVDRPLHDYVQHGANVIGHKADQDAPGLRDAVARLAAAFPHRAALAATFRQVVDQAALDCDGLVAQKTVLARILLRRCPDMTDAKRSILNRYAALDRLFPALRERLLAARDGRPTLNHEGLFLRAVLGKALRRLWFGLRRGRLQRQAEREQNRRAARNLLAGGNPAAPLSFAEATPGRVVQAMAFGDMAWIFGNLAPLRLAVTPEAPRRVNLLLATINFDYLFGGYIGMFNLALRLGREGHAVRIVLLEQTKLDLPVWRTKIGNYPGLTDLFDRVELDYRHDRSLALTVHPDDAFVATSGWSAHVAHRAVEDLGHGRPFLFMVQEYEPFFGPMNSATAILRHAYDLPHVALFSTDLLRDYFAQNGIGVFAQPDGDTRAAVFRNAIQPFAPTRALLTRTSRKILFYARPEAHAARNLFELGLGALVRLFEDPSVERAGWTVHGIGSIKSDARLELKPGVLLQMVPKTSLRDYAAMLPGFDVGLSLMLTPHPSLVPLEMAAAGLSTVTNTFANKTAERLSDLSANLIGVPPTLDGIVAGLRQAIARVEDIDARLAGARLDWPNDWDKAFDADAIAKLAAWLDANP